MAEEKDWQRLARQAEVLRQFAKEKVDQLNALQQACSHEGGIHDSAKPSQYTFGWWQCADCGKFIEEGHAR